MPATLMKMALATTKPVSRLFKICSVCPGACPYRDTAGEADECKDCLYENIDCRSVDCSNCIAGKAVMVAEGVSELDHKEEKGDD